MASFDAVGYLSLRLFPAKAFHQARAQMSDGKIRQADEIVVRAADTYEKALGYLSPASLAALVEDERQLEAAHRQEQSEEAERQRFFNRPDAVANFAFWAGQSRWTLDEATALILGKDPKIVSWDRIQPLFFSSAFAERFAEIRRHLNSAKRNGKLSDPVSPVYFVSWANARGVVLPADLQAQFEARMAKPAVSAFQHPGRFKPRAAGIPNTDPRPRRDGMDSDESIIHLGRDEGRQRALLRLNKTSGAKTGQPEAKRGTEPGRIFAGLVIAMAAGRYGFKPDRDRQSTVADIVADLRAIDIHVSKADVRSALLKACACLAGTDRPAKVQRLQTG